MVAHQRCWPPAPLPRMPGQAQGLMLQLFKLTLTHFPQYGANTSSLLCSRHVSRPMKAPISAASRGPATAAAMANTCARLQSKRNPESESKHVLHDSNVGHLPALRRCWRYKGVTKLYKAWNGIRSRSSRLQTLHGVDIWVAAVSPWPLSLHPRCLVMAPASWLHIIILSISQNQ